MDVNDSYLIIACGLGSGNTIRSYEYDESDD
jgi:hypothetical protein